MRKLYTIFILFAALGARGQVITTVAGNGSPGYTGDNGSAILASIGSAGGITFDGFGNYYISENNNTIRRVSATGIISKFAGTGTQGYSGDGGPAISAQLYLSGFMTSDRSGNLYFSEIVNNRIRKVDFNTGIISTVVGNGTSGFSGDGGAANLAQLNMPYGICFDKDGNLFVVDQLNYRIRKVDTNGIITTVAGTGIGGSTGDGGQATSARIYSPIAICADTSGNLYFTDSGRIRKINKTTGIVSAYAGNGAVGFSGDSGSALLASFSFPEGLVFDNYGNLYISDDNNNRVRMVDASGIIQTIAGNGISGYNGDGGISTLAELNSPRGIAVDSCDNLYIVDNGNHRIRKVAFNPTCSPNPEGVREVSKGSGMELYPNPVRGGLTLSLSKEEGSIEREMLCIMNSIGQVLLQKECTGTKTSIDVSGLPAGLYIVRVGDAVGRFVKE